MQFFRAQGADRVALSDTGVPVGFSRSASISQGSDVVTSVLLSCDQRIREAAFLCFSNTISHSFVHTLNAQQGKSLLRWLDVSGLALYFLDRISELGQRSCLPAAVLGRLECSQQENCKRTRGLIDESIRLQRDFQSTDISYAVMKGISLCPVSVPRLELRHQFDIDFLVSDTDAPAASRILERHGYTLFAISGRSWEFKKGQTPRVAPKDLYRDLSYRGVELHLESNTDDKSARLRRAVSRELHGLTMPILSPVDLFLGQAFHASKDISGPFLRASHLLEFYRHVLARRDDIGFWEELRQQVREDRRASLAIGMVTYLITSVLGDFAPRALTTWTMDEIPSGIQLWLDLYGRSTVLQVPPGTKRYLRLREEVERALGVSDGSSKVSLFSFSLPHAVIQAMPGETLSTRIARYRVQIRFLATRLRFHSLEGLRFVVESRRWRRLRSNLP